MTDCEILRAAVCFTDKDRDTTSCHPSGPACTAALLAAYARDRDAALTNCEVTR